MHEATVLFLILAGTLGLFIWGYWRYDIVACLALGACVAVGAVPFSGVFVGFSNPAVITVACVMIITHALNRSGIVDLLVKSLTPITNHEVLHIAALTLLAACLSAFMNNVGALALLMPVAIQTAIQAKRSPSHVLIPLALGSALGGLITSIGTPPNLLISSYRRQVLGQSYAMFDFSPVGLVLAAVGVTFVVLIGWRLLPARRKSAESTEDMFQIQDYITEITIPGGSPLVDKTINEFENLIEGDITILGLIRKQRKRLVFRPQERLQQDDIVIVEASHSDLEKLLSKGKFELVGGATVSQEELRSDEVGVLEAVVPPGSRIEGRSTRSLRLRTRYRINLLAIARQGRAFKQRLNKVTLQAGDVVMLQGEVDSLRETVVSLGFLPLGERGIDVGRKPRAILPLMIFAGAIFSAAMRVVPVEVAFAGAVVTLVISNVMPARRLYEAIDWPVIILLAAMIPVGGALQATGTTDLIAKSFVGLAGHLSPIWILGLLMLITMTLSDIMNNAATAVVMAPIGVGIAQQLHLNVDPFLMSVAVGASCSFLTPIGHQNNILVMGPGGYKFMDYFRIGIFLELIILAVGLPMILWTWPIK